MSEQIEDFKTFSQVTDARWYPRYHLAPPFGWCNDPNGMCFYKGQYHFFYQHYPYAPEWGPMHWGHAVSDDLAYWKHLPIALKPEQPYEQGGGCFSGSAIEKDGKLYLMYTGHLSATPEEEAAIGFPHIEFQCLASSEDGVHFKKSEKNPVIEDIDIKSDDVSINDIRDPKVWIHNGKYYAVLGSRTPDMAHGQILLFESKDLTTSWRFKAISARSEGDLGGMWECPNFAEIDGHDVLIFSPMDVFNSEKYYHDKIAGVLIGKLNYRSGLFTHGDFQYLDKGFDFYAPQIMQTPDGRTVMIAWMDMWNVDMHETKDGWAGMMTIPRVLGIKNGKIISNPVKELEKLRKWKPIILEDVLIDEATTFDGVSGEAYELLLNIDAAQSKKFSIALRASDIEQTVLSYNANGIFKLDRTNSGEPINFQSVREIQIEPCEKLKLHIFIDRSSIEVFINDGAEVLSARIYPKRTSQKVIFLPEDEQLKIDSLEYYKLDFGIPHPHIKDTPEDLTKKFPFLK